MDFWQAISTCFHKYADFSGRAQRSEYWWWALFGLLGGITFGLLDAALFGMGPFIAPQPFNISQPFNTSQFFGILGIIFFLITFLPYIAVTARRLHDIDKSGWWQIMPLLLPIVLFAVLDMLSVLIVFVNNGNEALATAIGIAVWVIAGTASNIAFIVLIVWLATKGTQGDNSFGPDPLTEEKADEEEPVRPILPD